MKFHKRKSNNFFRNGDKQCRGEIGRTLGWWDTVSTDAGAIAFCGRAPLRCVVYVLGLTDQRQWLHGWCIHTWLYMLFRYAKALDLMRRCPSSRTVHGANQKIYIVQ